MLNVADVISTLNLPKIKPDQIKLLEVHKTEQNEPVAVIVGLNKKDKTVLFGYEVEFEKTQEREVRNAKTRAEMSEYFEAVGVKIPDWSAIERAHRKIRHDDRTKHRDPEKLNKKRNKAIKHCRKQTLKQLEARETEINQNLLLPGVASSEVGTILREELSEIQEHKAILKQK
jgi:hypothetical protein